MPNWYRAVGDYLGGWPDDYVVFDCETNGINVKDPMVLPLQIGWCVVEDRAVTYSGSVFLDWTKPGIGISEYELAQSIDRVRAAMEAKGRTYHCSMDLLAAKGIDPQEGLEIFAEILQGSVDEQKRLAGHNCYAYDCPLLSRAIQDHLSRNLVLPAAAIIDTGMIEKARQIPGIDSVPFDRRMDLATWYRLVSATRSRVTWNLDTHVPRQYGIEVDLASAHDAEYDCVLVHRLIEKMRALSEDPS